MIIENKSRHAVSLLGLLVFLILAVGSVDDSGSDSYKRTPAKRNWYEGGTLHRAGVLAWQEADYKNKLATCSDFIAAQWQSENFKSSIHYKIKTVDDMHPYAVELVICLDAAAEKHPDPETNYNMYANQTVAEMATMCMIMMGWTR